MLVAKLEEALMLVVAPEIVAPAVPVRRPAEVIVPLLVVDILPVVVIASPELTGDKVVPLLVHQPWVPVVALVAMAPSQVRLPLLFVTVQPAAPRPPASNTSPVDMPPIETVFEPLALIVSAPVPEMAVPDTFSELTAEPVSVPPERVAVFIVPCTVRFPGIFGLVCPPTGRIYTDISPDEPADLVEVA
jgi:hypothetical protein